MPTSRQIYMVGVLDALRSLGGRATLDAVYEWLIVNGVAIQRDLEIIQSDHGTRFHKEVRWARKELYDAALLEGSDRGVWALTPAGADLKLTPTGAGAILRLRSYDKDLEGAELSTNEQTLERPEPIELAEALGVAEAPNSTFVPTTGPAPTAWSGEVVRRTSIDTWTYLMRFGTRDVWKIGHTCDVARRLADINRHVPVEALGEAWSIVRTHHWPNAILAHRMEQRLFHLLKKHRTTGERLGCAEGQLERGWSKCIAGL